MKRKAGDIFPNLTLTTSQGKPLMVPVPGARFTHVQFRRWTGCPICNTHIASLRRNADRIASAGIYEVLFFHSSQQDVKSFHQDLPFDAVADPGKRYYREVGVEQSWAYAMHPRVLWAALKGMGSRFNLAMTGGPTGLPAEFLIASDGLIKAVKYGRHAFDQWSVEELLELAKQSAFASSSETTRNGRMQRANTNSAN
jgi:peroxiredoxin